MAKKEDDQTTPNQYKGNKLNVEHSIIASSIKEASLLFKEALKRLLDVNSWEEITNTALSSFQLIDEKGNEVYRDAREGDLFKIKIPGPGSVAGDGYDWVQVELITFKANRVAMRVRPAASPEHPNAGTAHFFARDATSTFQIFRRGRIVTAAVYGRNEVPNINSDKIFDSVRNTAVAVGAIVGASRIQWESLVHGIIHGHQANNS